MIFASPGYLAISLDFMDETATTATDRDGKPIIFSWGKGFEKGLKLKDGSPNMEIHNHHK